MSISQHIEELTDSYLRGDLSGLELESFENLIASDLAVKQHVTFQKQLTEGIANYRRVQLKSRLDAIQIGTGWTAGGLLGEGMLKIAAGTVVATIIGTGVFYTWPLLNETSSQDKVLDLTVDSDVAFDEDQELSVPLPLNTTLLPIDEEETGHIAVSEDKLTNKAGKAIAEEVTMEDTKTIETVATNYVPKVNIPSFNDVTDESEFVSQEVSIPEVSKDDIVNEKDKAPIDIKTFNRKSEEITYKYFDGKLFLYGDFKNRPYEILEINSRASRQLYLYHGEKYFAIAVTDAITTLKPILSDKLINELQIIRNNKIN